VDKIATYVLNLLTHHMKQIRQKDGEKTWKIT
jgi:hypothetical protein